MQAIECNVSKAKLDMMSISHEAEAEEIKKDALNPLPSLLSAA